MLAVVEPDKPAVDTGVQHILLSVDELGHGKYGPAQFVGQPRLVEQRDRQPILPSSDQSVVAGSTSTAVLAVARSLLRQKTAL